MSKNDPKFTTDKLLPRDHDVELNKKILAPRSTEIRQQKIWR